MYKQVCTILVGLLSLVLFLTGCSSTNSTPESPQTLIAVAAVGTQEQGLLQFYQSASNGEVSAANLPAPGYPLGGKWSPNGRFYAFVLIRSVEDIDIYRLDFFSKELLRLTNTPTCPEIGLSWTGDGLMIHYAAFCRDGGTSTGFYRMTSDGAQQSKLGEAAIEAGWVVFSPDLNHAALINLLPHGSAIYAAGVDGSNLTTVALDGSSGYQRQAATILDWSPDSSLLIYATQPITVGLASANQLILTKPDGTGRRVLVQPPAGLQCFFPRWSPENTLILFTCGPDLMTIHLDGSGLANLSNAVQGKLVEYPAWLEGGNGIVFLSGLEPGIRSVERIQSNGLLRTTLGEVNAGVFYGLEWQPSASVPQPSSTTASSSPDQPTVAANPSDLQSPEFEAETWIPWLIAGWLMIMLTLAGVFAYRAVLKSALRLPGMLGKIRSSEQRRQGRRAIRRTDGVVNQASENKAREALSIDKSQSGKPAVTASNSLAGAETYSVDPSEAMLQDGITRARSGDAAGAMEVLRTYLAQYPDDSMAWLWLGFASGLRNDWRGAESCFRRAGKLGNPQYEEALTWLEEQKNLLE